jgi:hypothetical protein
LEVTVSFLGIHKWEPGFSPALHLQCMNERVGGKNSQKGKTKSEWKRIGIKKGRDGDKRWIGGKEVREERIRGEERKGKEGKRLESRTIVQYKGKGTYRRNRNVLKVTERVTERQEAHDRRKKPKEKEQTDGKGRKKDEEKGKKETDRKAKRVKEQRDFWERGEERGKGRKTERTTFPTCY